MVSDLPVVILTHNLLHRIFSPCSAEEGLLGTWWPAKVKPAYTCGLKIHQLGSLGSEVPRDFKNFSLPFLSLKMNSKYPSSSEISTKKTRQSNRLLHNSVSTLHFRSRELISLQSFSWPGRSYTQIKNALAPSDIPGFLTVKPKITLQFGYMYPRFTWYEVPHLLDFYCFLFYKNCFRHQPFIHCFLDYFSGN